MYANPGWVRGVTAGYMEGPEEMQDTKGGCLMMVMVDVKLGDLPPPVRRPEEGDDDRLQQWVQQVQVGTRWGVLSGR